MKEQLEQHNRKFGYRRSNVLLVAPETYHLFHTDVVKLGSLPWKLTTAGNLETGTGTLIKIGNWIGIRPWLLEFGELV